MHRAQTNCRAGQGWRTHPRRVRAASKRETFARVRGSPLQKQHRLCRAQLRLSRQLPDAPGCGVGPARCRHLAVFDHAPNFCRSRKNGHRSGERVESTRRVSNFAARGFFQRAREHRHDEPAAAHQHARRTARRCKPLSALPRHPGRLEHERMGDGDENRDDRARARSD